MTTPRPVVRTAGPRAPWTPPSLTRLPSAHAQGGANTVNPEGPFGFGS